MSEMISFGAGVNSVAMTIMLVNKGWHGPIVFADTGCEWPETYCYLDYFEKKWLAPRGLEITRLGQEYRALGPGRDARTLIEFCEDYRVCPMPGTRWCTQGWKTDVVNHWAKANNVEIQLIGIAADEAHRMPGAARPLVDRDITRKDCIAIIAASQLDIPQKSGCYICPFQRPDQWRELWSRHPELFERAARLEKLSTERRGVRTFLIADSRFTLEQLSVGFESQLIMWNDEQWAGLQAYKPCICSL